MTSKTADDQQLDRTLGAVAAVGVLLGIGTFALFGVHAGLSALVGSAVAVANLWLLARSVKKLMTGVGQAKWGAIAFLKFTGLFAGTYALSQLDWVQMLFLAVGFGALPLGIVIAGLVWSAPSSPAQETDHA